MKKTLLLVTLRHSIKAMYTKELTKIFGDHLTIQSFSLENPQNAPFTDLLLHNVDAVLIPTFGVYEVVKEYLTDDIPVVMLYYTFSQEKINLLKKLPRGTDVYVGFTFPVLSQNTVFLLQKAGMNHLNYHIYDKTYSDSYDLNSIEVAVVGDDSNSFPPGMKNLLSLGPRKIDITTILDISSALSVMDDKLEQNIYAYCSDLLVGKNSLNYFYNETYTTQVQFRSIIDCLDDGLLMLNRDRLILDVNQPFLKLFHVKEIITGLCLDEIPELAELCQLVCADYRLDDTYRHRLVTLQALGKDLLISKMQAEENHPIHAVTVLLIKDVTEVMRLQNSVHKQLSQRGHVAKYTFQQIISQDRGMLACIEKAKKLSALDKPTLLIGESGTGKELFAQSMHNTSPRRSFPFIALNCAALPATLLESELFGYEEGSFTGARKGGKKGLFEMASGGTLFLDEIGEMTLDVQAKLLRVLEEQEIMKLGGSEIISVDVRIIAATNRNLSLLINENKFRMDLFFRLNTIMLKIPPLRDRPGDIALLMQEMLRSHDAGYKQIDPEVLHFMTHYPWRGNVRELRNCVEYMNSVSGDRITLDHLPEYMLTEELICIPGQSAAPSRQGETVTLLEQEAREQILTLLSNRSMGRHALTQALRTAGLTISEYKLRLILDSLAEEGLILFGRGRSGAMLTVKGKRFLGP